MKKHRGRMKHELKINPGDRYTKNGKTVEVDFVDDGIVCLRKWGRFKWGLCPKSEPFLIQMAVAEFTRQVKELKGKR